MSVDISFMSLIVIVMVVLVMLMVLVLVVLMPRDNNRFRNAFHKVQRDPS